MTEDECTLLMGFLRQLNQTPTRFKDPLADKLIREQIDLKPDAHYLLVQRALELEMELGRLKESLRDSNMKQISQEAQSPNPYGFINSNPNLWGSSSGPKTEDSLVDKITSTTPSSNWEDRAVKFLSKHSLKLWLAIALIWCVVIYIK